MLENLDFNYLLSTYGYLAILVLTFLEGETIVIVAGFLASRGTMDPFLIALCAFCGSSLSDQLMFSLGKYKGPAVLKRFPKLNKNVDKASRLITKYENILILGFRFVYGVRNVTPVLLGISQVSHLKFLALNLIGAAVWATIFTAGGYYMGNAFLHLVDKIGHTAAYVLAAILVLAIIALLIRKRLQAAQATKAAAAAKSVESAQVNDTATAAETDALSEKNDSLSPDALEQTKAAPPPEE